MMERSIDLAEGNTVTMYDTIQIVKPVYDTTAVTVYDTVRLTVYDTVEVMNDLADTTGQSLDEAVAVAAAETVDEPVQVKKLKVDKKKLEADRLINILEDDGVTREVLEAIHGDIPQYTTVLVARLDSVQRVVLAATFDLQPDQIRWFRWGHSMAPAADPSAGRMFCAVWTDEQAEPLMLRTEP